MNDDGVSVFSVADGTDAFTMPGDPDPVTLAAGTLTSVHNESDSEFLELNGARGVTTTVVGTTTYLFVTGRIDSGVSVFLVGSNGMLASVDNIDNTTGSTGGITLELSGAEGVTAAVVDATTYLFVAADDDDGVSVFSVADDGMLTPVHNEPDDGSLELNGASGVTTAVVGTTTYLFVAGDDDHGVSVFRVQ